MRYFSVLCVPVILILLLSFCEACREPFFGYGGRSCYYFHNVTATLGGHTYKDSRLICRNFGGDLASIGDKNESALITRMFSDSWVKKYQTYWIGLDDFEEKGKFVWTDGTKFGKTSFRNWQNGSDSGKGNCVKVGWNGTWSKTRCDLLFGFVCERKPDADIPLKPTLPSIAQVSTAPQTCEVGWKPWGTSCYEIVTGSKKRWADARADCERKFSDLLIVDNQNEQNFLVNILSKYAQNFWIGLTDKRVEGTYVWVNEAKTNFTKWLPGQPDDAFGKEDCVVALGGPIFSAGWMDDNCDVNHNYICEKNTATPKCPQDWITHGDYCYQLNGHPVQRFPWYTARRSCLAFNAHLDTKTHDVPKADLVSILSEDEQKMIYTELKNIGVDVEETFYWIGLQTKNKKWSWSDLSPYKYQNWLGNATELRRGLCVKSSLVGVSGSWTLGSCSEKHIFVCKVKRGSNRCYNPLGMQNYQIPDSAITSNSELTFSTLAIASRFYLQPGNTLDGAWCAEPHNKKSSYLQVDFGQPYKFTYVGVQGKANSDAMVTEFMLMHSHDGKSWDPYHKSSFRFRVSRSVYLAKNRTRDQVEQFRLNYPLTSRYIRIYPLSCHVDCCMRIEFFGCEYEEGSVKCGPGWKEDPWTSGRCYRLSEQTSSWDDATTYCINHGGNLLSTASKRENDHIKKVLYPLRGRTYDYWIGLNDLAEKGLFRWEDGTPLTYVNWATNNPIKDSKVAYRIPFTDCWVPCGKKGGLCMSYCGKNSYCCRRGWADCPLELSRVAYYSWRHSCVRAPGKIQKQCVSIRSKDGKWTSHDCALERHFICKRVYKGLNKVAAPFSTNWRTGAHFYWPLDKVVNKSALGTVSGVATGLFPQQYFNVSGEGNTRRSVLHFDGKTNFLELPLTGSCSSNPDSSSCVHGFTLGLLFRSDEDISATEAFIVDNMGQRDDSTLGYSVGIVLGQLFVKLRGHEKSYIAHTEFPKRTWNHFAFTWFPLRGLLLYINGNNTSSDGSGTKNMHVVRKKLQRLVVGKSSTRPQFTRIKLASLALFERALSRNEVHDIYLAELGHCSRGQLTHGSFCYEFNMEAVRSSYAVLKCRNKGGNLMSIHSPIEQAWLSYILHKYNKYNNGVYIGLNSRNNANAETEWDDGTSVIYSYWGPYMPKNSGSWKMRMRRFIPFFDPKFRPSSLRNRFGHPFGRHYGRRYPPYRRYPFSYRRSYQAYATNNGHWVIPSSSYARKGYVCKFRKVVKNDIKYREILNIQRRGYFKFTCPLTDTVKIISVNYTHTGKCGLNSSMAKQLVEARCNGPICDLTGLNPCQGYQSLASHRFNIMYQCLPFPSPSPEQQGCNEGYVNYIDGVCYKLYLTEMTIFKAIQRCEKDGAKLVSISSHEQETVLASMMVQLYKRSEVWIGLRYNSTSQEYTWMDGRRVTYTNWYNGYPDPRVGEFVKVSAHHHGADKLLFWHIANQRETHPFFCGMLKVNTTVVPANTTETPTGNCPKDWVRYGINCYFILKIGLGHMDASSACSRLTPGADLASILTNEENSFVFELLQSKTQFHNAWIGLTNEAIIRGYHWRDSNPLQFINWYTNNPNTGRRHLCVGMNRAGKWWDLHCSSKYISVCKVRVADELPSTPSTSSSHVPAKGRDEPPYCHFTLGTGVGGSQTRERRMPSRQCIQRCLELKKTKPLITGVTVDTRGANECYCQINRRTWNQIARYQSCEFQDSKPVNPKSIHILTNYTIKRKQLLTTVSVLRKEYSVSFDLLLTAFTNRSVYTSVFHMTTGARWSIGARIPAVFVSPNNMLHISTAINTDYNNFGNFKVMLNTWTKVTMKQTKVGTGSHQFQIIIDSKLVHTRYNYRPREFQDLEIYIGDPWYTPQAGIIRNLIIDGTCCARIEKGSEMFYHPSKVLIKKNQVLPPLLKHLKKEYSVSFEINPRSYSSDVDNKEIHSIMYLGSRSSASEFTPDSPWIYIHQDKEKTGKGSPTRGTTQLCMLIHRGMKKCVPVHLPLNRWTSVQISQLKYASDYIFQLSVNGSVKFDIKNEHTKTYRNLSVYFADAYNTAVNGSVRNITIKDLLFCEPGWRTVNKSCYYFSKRKAVFEEARRICRNMSAQLVTISGSYENKMITETANSLFGGRASEYMYIGLNDRSDEGGWQWVDGTAVNYVNWGSDQPDDHLGGEDCVSLLRNGGWADVPCNHQGYFICEKSEDPDAEEKEEEVGPVVEDVGVCDDGWIRYGSKCFLFQLDLNDTCKFEDALAHCREYDGNLVSIHNVQENAFFLSQLYQAYAGIWIGLTDLRVEGRFLWTDQSRVDFTYWGTREPNNARNEDCVHLRTRMRYGKWNDISCEYKMNFVCQKMPNVTEKRTKPTSKIPLKYDCPDGYQRYRKNCYKIFSKQMSWIDALGECRKQKKGDLVSIHDMYVQAFVFSRSVNVNFSSWWIGLHKTAKGEDLVWSDNSPIMYQFWKDGRKPYVINASTLCISEENNRGMMDGLWRVRNCSAKLPFVCQVSNSPVVRSPAFLGNCTVGWTKLGSMCYKYMSNDQQKWQEAQQKCELEGGGLVTVVNEQIQKFVSNIVLYHKRHIWIGLNDREKESVFKWNSGTPMSFTYWQPGEPNQWKGKPENCVMVWGHTGTWNDAPCTGKFNYICEHPLWCRDPLGMGDGKILDSAIHATSYRGTNFPANARLNFRNNMSFPDAWCTNSSIDDVPALTIDLGDLVTITRIETQGLGADYVTAYNLDYSEDGKNWFPYLDENGVRTLQGNEQSRSTSIQTTTTTTAATTSVQTVGLYTMYLRFKPVTYIGAACLRFELYGCKAVCSRPLGMSTHMITDDKLSASSNPAAVGNARPPHSTGWCSGVGETGTPWFQIELNHVMKITRIMAMGSNVETYVVLFGTSDDTMVLYRGYDGQVRIFPIHPTLHELEYPRSAKLVKFKAGKWGKQMCLQVELYGCEIECDDPLGMESMLIDNSAITASSQLTEHPSYYGRLNNGAWCAKLHDRFQYIQVTLPDISKVTHIATQGFGESYVKLYNLQWSKDGIFYLQLKEQLSGNTNGDDIMKIKLKEPLIARYIRLIPTDFESLLCLRLEIYGCSLKTIYPVVVKRTASKEDTISKGGRIALLTFFLLLLVAVFVAGFIYYRRKRRDYNKPSSVFRVHAKDDEVEIMDYDDDYDDDETTTFKD